MGLNDMRGLDYSGLMWFNLNGHRAKSEKQESEVSNEQRPKATKLHKRIQARRRQAGTGTRIQQP